MQDNTIAVNKSDSIAKTFWRFAIPSLAAMIVNGLYQVIDGIFVGHYIGFEGLAGINMAWPALGAIMGFGIMIGMGGGTLISIARGEKALDKAKLALSTSIWLIILFGALSMAILQMGGERFLLLQNGEGRPLAYGLDYIGVFSYGAVFSIAACALPTLVRNDDSPKIATALTVISALLNIVLDYLFIGVFQWGLKGAAIATLISQVVVVVLGLGYFLVASQALKLRQAPFSIKEAWRIVTIGASSLLMFIYFGFIIAFHNSLLMSYGSAVHVGAFAIIGYIATMYYLTAEGIAGGLQPPVSYYLGAQEYVKIEKTVKLAFSVILGAGLLTLAVLNVFPDTIINIFSRGDSALLEAASHGMRLHLSAIFLDGFLFLASIYFMAVDKGGKALVIAAGNMVVQIPFLYALPQWFGIDGVWLAVPLSNVALTLVIAPMLWKDMKSLSKQQVPADSIIA
ncbi:MATE family efflux transporter [Thaumasiovibrio subtropicus]|uniref:MATE family efflux transporter n=1 Tax=Thaumasiovibrio subtropicus TaxID=1891207 RepID=UPI000B351B1E|nr:MATE family efflux transporter [Thaumasiovibrio subtropicus]